MAPSKCLWYPPSPGLQVLHLCLSCLMFLSKYQAQHPAGMAWGLLTLMAPCTPVSLHPQSHIPKPPQVAPGGNVVSVPQDCHADLSFTPWCSWHFCSTHAFSPRGSQAFWLPTSQERMILGDGDSAQSRLCTPLPSQPHCSSPCRGGCQCSINNSLLSKNKYRINVLIPPHVCTQTHTHPHDRSLFN